MTTVSVDELSAVFVECAGEDEGGEITPSSLDTTFEDLGYDSLALMEVTARISQRTGLAIPDDQVADLETPRALLDLINSLAVSA
ncbi:acyl carrier protein [Pseudofrankia inefficax]|uniref:Phosphopantetheine-binding protein n=1 Tax=Pseudofrankia inefficax (strain DSM 45817 / CECT 9037 / DDB 130130 / EuI1c) TaxID=298654 RepID=E3J3P9_PSEI1|nr:acyl carrier protein [Pseudofrankia inefficax]ADP79386.1 phosphopantetheine-binding protein [Pseudofrankia inefficax]